jgi:hypothetical protein
MITVIYSGTYKAKREYDDEAFWFVNQFVEDGCKGTGRTIKDIIKPSFAEYRVLVKFRHDQEYARKIKPGQAYVRQFNETGGYLYTYRAKKELHDIAVKFKLYNDL